MVSNCSSKVCYKNLGSLHGQIMQETDNRGNEPRGLYRVITNVHGICLTYLRG